MNNLVNSRLARRANISLILACCLFMLAFLFVCCGPSDSSVGEGVALLLLVMLLIFFGWVVLLISVIMRYLLLRREKEFRSKYQLVVFRFSLAVVILLFILLIANMVMS